MNNLALSVAHQIRNRTATIGGFAQKLLRDFQAMSKPSVYTEIIYQEAGRLEELVDAVVRLAGLSRLTSVETSMRPVIEHSVARAAEMAAGLHKDVAWSLDIEDGVVPADPELMGVALIEVLKNAMEFGDASRVEVSVTSRKEDGYTIRVSDDGPGVEAGNRPFVFDPFFSTKPQGPGIGLTLARKIAVEHDGRLFLEYDVDRGVSAVMTIGRSGEAGAGDDVGADVLDVRSLLARAGEVGADVAGLNYIDAVREVQRREGFEPCFAGAGRDRCGRDGCAFRNACRSVGAVGGARKITFGGA